MSELNTYKLRRLRIKRKARDTMKRVADRLDEEYKQMVRELHEELEDKKIEGVAFDGIRFSPYATRRAYVESEEDFVQWANANEPSLVQVTARQGLLNQEVNRRLDDGEPLPPGVKFTSTPKISQRKA